MRKRGHGVVLGKFMPPHAGHIEMIHFAQASCHALTVLVCSTPRDPIPGPVRFAWVKEMFPRANVVHHYADVPQEPKDHPDFWQIWIASMREHAPGETYDAVFGSEDYGWELARRLGAEYVPVNRVRDRIPVSGTAVREDPMKQWEFIPTVARPYFAKRVAILGPMSTGKSTMAKDLGLTWRSTHVDEYARGYCEEMVRAGIRRNAEVREEDLEAFARGQVVLEECTAYRANRVLFCDTDVLTTYTYAMAMFKGCPRWIEDEAMTKQYDLTLVLEPTDQYVQDGERVMVNLDSRKLFLERLCDNLDRTQRKFFVVKPEHHWNARFLTVMDLVNQHVTPDPYEQMRKDVAEKGLPT